MSERHDVSNNRNASESLKGYYYQFDKTILELLELKSEGDSVNIEDIEDIDIITASETTAIQCKYFEAQEYFPSRIRKPICLMLDDFRQRINYINYNLYVYFKNIDKIPISLDLNQLKSILKFSENGNTVEYNTKNNMTDEHLLTFLEHFSIKSGKNYEEQKKNVIQKLKDEFRCSKEEEVEHYFYNNSLRFIFSRAILKDKLDRTITRKKFIDEINRKEFLFNEWYLQLKSKNKYIDFVKGQIRNQKGLRSQKKKALFISKSVLQHKNSQMTITAFIRNLLDTYYKPGHTLFDAEPWTIILDLNIEEMNELKKELLESDIFFNDGFESIQFTPKYFNQSPLIYREKTSNDRIKATIEKASYSIRIISNSTFTEYTNKILKCDSIFIISSKDIKFDHYNGTGQIFTLKNIQSLDEIMQVIM